MYSNEHHKRLNELYNELENLKEAKKVIQNAIHNNFYNRVVADGLYNKINAINKKIQFTRELIKKENENEQRKNV